MLNACALTRGWGRRGVNTAWQASETCEGAISQHIEYAISDDGRGEWSPPIKLRLGQHTNASVRLPTCNTHAARLRCDARPPVQHLARLTAPRTPGSLLAWRRSATRAAHGRLPRVALSDMHDGNTTALLTLMFGHAGGARWAVGSRAAQRRQRARVAVLQRVARGLHQAACGGAPAAAVRHRRRYQGGQAQPRQPALEPRRHSLQSGPGRQHPQAHGQQTLSA